MQQYDKEEYDKVAQDYSNLIQQDPVKVYAQYPSVLKMLGDISGQLILDMGCGDGLFAREMAKRGAHVVAFDISSEQIALAEKASQGMDIEHLIASQETFKPDRKFDQVLSAMVLIYAKDKDELRKFFEVAYDSLKSGGTFIMLTVFYDNIIGPRMFNRIVRRLEGNAVEVEFYYGDNMFRAHAFDYRQEEYEEAAKLAGFDDWSWHDLEVQPNPFPEEFWKPFNDHKPWKIGVFKK